MNQKQVAFLCHPYHRGGVTRWMADAAIFYSQIGYKVCFVTPTPSIEFFSARGREPMVKLLQNGNHDVLLITTDVGREFEFGTPEYRTYIYKTLLAQVPLGMPVIISDDSSVWAAACAMKASLPVVGVLHADDAAYYNLSTRYRNDVEVFVSVSQRVDQLFKEKCPEVDRSKLFTIPCGINLPAAPAAREVNKRIEILYVGRIERGQKRTEDLIAVAAALQKSAVPFRLTVIGDGVEVKAVMEQKVKELGLSDNVVFTGWLSQQNVLEKMTASDVLILVSNYEGMPISMMEGLACGCGFAGTRVSGIEDYEHHALAADCFRVFAIGDTDGAASMIQEIAEVGLETRRKAARMLAEEQFSMARCIDRYNEAMATSIRQRQYTPTVATIPFSARLKSRLLALLRHAKMSLRSK